MDIGFTSLETILGTFKIGAIIGGCLVPLILVFLVLAAWHSARKAAKEKKKADKERAKALKKQQKATKVNESNTDKENMKKLKGIGLEPEDKARYETLTLKFDNEGRVINED